MIWILRQSFSIIQAWQWIHGRYISDFDPRSVNQFDSFSNNPFLEQIKKVRFECFESRDEQFSEQFFRRRLLWFESWLTKNIIHKIVYLLDHKLSAYIKNVRSKTEWFTYKPFGSSVNQSVSQLLPSKLLEKTFKNLKSFQSYFGSDQQIIP